MSNDYDYDYTYESPVNWSGGNDFSDYSGGSWGDSGSNYTYTPSASYSPNSAPYNPGIDFSIFTGPLREQDTAVDPLYNSNGQAWSTPSVSYGGSDTPQQGALSRLNGLLQSAQDEMGTPLGKTLMSLPGAALAAYDQSRANRQQKKIAAKQAAMLAQRRAEAMRFNEPLRLQAVRQAAAPVARRGESQFFSNNRLPSYFAEGGQVYDPKEDKMGAMNMLRYMFNGHMLPSEVREQKEYDSAMRQYNSPIARRERQAMQEAGQDVTPPPTSPVRMKAEGGGIGGLRQVKGGSAGQADDVPARLSPGEYVMDADVVSALGDGNNDAGAKKLDQMRQSVRSHKRSAPSDQIPPKAKSPLAYMKKGVK